MLNEEIIELRRKLNESVTNKDNYKNTYKLSIELDELITKYYNKKLSKNDNIYKKSRKNKWFFCFLRLNTN